MSFELDFLIPRKNISKLGLVELFVEWGGVQFSQEPPKYSNGSNLVFEQSNDTKYYEEYYNRYSEKELRTDDCIILRSTWNDVFCLERKVNTNNKEALANGLVPFLNELSRLDSFVVFLIRDEECIDRRYQVEQKGDLVDIILRSLNWSSPEGVLITKG